MNARKVITKFIISIIAFYSCNTAYNRNVPNMANDLLLPSIDIPKTRAMARLSLDYAQENQLSTAQCILIDMSVHSGLNRCVIWDFGRDTIADAYVVSHGCCDGPWGKDLTKSNPKFSNIEDSHCSSLGRYRIGDRAPSEWGVKVKYILHGLDSTNDNALKRVIVFHSWESVSDVETYPAGTPEGWGCPTLSNNNFLKVDALIKKNAKPMLMWIYK